VDTSSLIPSDPLTRVRGLFLEQLRRFIDAAATEDDPQEIYQDRIRELELLYTAFPHYLQSDYRENYARKYRAEIISRRAEILSQFRAFHHDPAFIAYLKQHHPHLYLIGQHETILLALAEKLDASTLADGSLPSPYRKPTIEEVRSSMVQRERTKIGDQTAMAYVALEQIDELKDLEKAKIKEVAARDDLTDEEKDERIQGIKAMTQQRFNMLLEGTRDAQNHQPTDTPPPAVILGQP
jgi:hypothetical protein